MANINTNNKSTAQNNFPSQHHATSNAATFSPNQVIGGVGNAEHQQRRIYHQRLQLGAIENGKGKGKGKPQKGPIQPSIIFPPGTTPPQTAPATGKEYLQVVNGKVSINGTSGNDTIALKQDAVTKEWYVDVNGKRSYIHNEDLANLHEISVNSGNGNDIIDFSANTNPALSLNADGGQGDDQIIGGAGNDTLMGGTGNDDISGGDGNDLLRGSLGDDHLDGGAGNDEIHGGLRGTDTIIGGEGDDHLFGRKGVDLVEGGGQNDQITWRGLKAFAAQNGKDSHNPLDTADLTDAKSKNPDPSSVDPNLGEPQKPKSIWNSNHKHKKKKTSASGN